MGRGKDAPEPPDYGPLAEMSEKSAKYSYRLGKQQLAWAKEQYGRDSELISRIVDANLSYMDENQANARADRARYEDTFIPLEDQMIEDANMSREDMLRRREQYRPVEDAMLAETLRYGDPAFKEAEAGRAMADVASQMEAARKTALSNLESFGINPSAVRYAGLDRAAALQRAASAAAAGEMKRGQVDDTRRGLQDRALGYEMSREGVSRGAVGDAINVGRGLPSQALAGYGAAMQGGQNSVNSRLAGTASGASTMGTAPQWQGIGNQGVAMWGDILNAGYNNELNAWNASQNASSGFGSILGLAGGMIAPHLAEGGEVPDMASPTMGAIEDDVPARLTPGEFVIPKEVVEWLGEKAMHQMIMKAKKEMEAIPGESGAQAEMYEVEDEEPTFASSGIPDDGGY